MVPASHILMCHREQTGTESNTKEGRKKKKEALLIKQLVVHSSDLEKKNPLLLLSNRMTSNNVQQKHCRKLFTLKQTKKDHSFQSKSAVHSILQQNSNNHVSIKDEVFCTIRRKTY